MATWSRPGPKAPEVPTMTSNDRGSNTRPPSAGITRFRFVGSPAAAGLSARSSRAPRWFGRKYRRRLGGESADPGHPSFSKEPLPVARLHGEQNAGRDL